MVLAPGSGQKAKVSFCSRGSGRQEGEAGIADQGTGSQTVTVAGGVLALGTGQKPGTEHQSASQGRRARREI